MTPLNSMAERSGGSFDSRSQMRRDGGALDGEIHRLEDLRGGGVGLLQGFRDFAGAAERLDDQAQAHHYHEQLFGLERVGDEDHVGGDDDDAAGHEHDERFEDRGADGVDAAKADLLAHQPGHNDAV